MAIQPGCLCATFLCQQKQLAAAHLQEVEGSTALFRPHRLLYCFCCHSCLCCSTSAHLQKVEGWVQGEADALLGQQRAAGGGWRWGDDIRNHVRQIQTEGQRQKRDRLRILPSPA